jgi:hypothetical protein
MDQRSSPGCTVQVRSAPEVIPVDDNGIRRFGREGPSGLGGRRCPADTAGPGGVFEDREPELGRSSAPAPGRAGGRVAPGSPAGLRGPSVDGAPVTLVVVGLAVRPEDPPGGGPVARGPGGGVGETRSEPDDSAGPDPLMSRSLGAGPDARTDGVGAAVTRGPVDVGDWLEGTRCRIGTAESDPVWAAASGGVGCGVSLAKPGTALVRIAVPSTDAPTAVLAAHLTQGRCQRDNAATMVVNRNRSATAAIVHRAQI